MLARENAARLLVIRTGLLLGVLVFGAVTWYLRRAGSLETIAANVTERLGYVFIAMAVGVIGALFALRMRVQSVTDARQQFALYIAGYAAAEGAALFGGVIWYLGGVREWYIAGLVLMVVAFQMLPIRRGDARR
jgi:hypothetical protein